MWWQHVWPCLQHEMRTAEVLAAVLQPALSLVAEATTNEYETIILPTFRFVKVISLSFTFLITSFISPFNGFFTGFYILYVCTSTTITITATILLLLAFVVFYHPKIYTS